MVMPFHALPRLFGHVLDKLRNRRFSCRHPLFVWVSRLDSEIDRLRFRLLLFLFAITLVTGSGLVEIMQSVQVLVVGCQVDNAIATAEVANA